MVRFVAAALALALAGGQGARAQAQAAQADIQPPHGDTPPVDYHMASNWVCRPGVDDGTCSANLDAVTVDAAGQRTPRPFAPAKAPAIDCFYVYPTASRDPTYYSDLAVDRTETRAIHGEASRLAERCRLFVPIYHQLTITALRWAMTHDGQERAEATGFDIPYRDIRAAWRDYLARDNHGRGVVLVGHSQGAILLKRLIAEEIDGKPAQKHLVAAYLAGNRDLKTTSFKSVRPCASPSQTGCVVAWSTVRDGATGPHVFGHNDGGRAICVNPAAPAGGRAPIDAFLSRPAIAPETDPPYVEAVGQLTAECIDDGHGTVLSVRVEPGKYAGLLRALLDTVGKSGTPGWGLHTLDVGLVQGSMLSLIGTQTAAWQSK